MNTLWIRVAVLCAGFSLALGAAAAQNLRLVNPPPVSGTGEAFAPSISADGRHVAFVSSANLTAGEPAETHSDVYLRDMSTGAVTRVSVGHLGVAVNGSSSSPDVSADGRFVAFTSLASNLVASDTNGVADVFLRDTWLGVTTLVSVSDGGLQGDGASTNPSVSFDGSNVAFLSSAANLVPGDTNTVADVFVRSVAEGRTYRASVGPNGLQANNVSSTPRLSGDGRIVAFYSAATNLDPALTAPSVYVHDIDWRTTRAVGGDPAGFWPATALHISAGAVAISPDGRFVAFGASYAGLGDSVVVRDLRTGLAEIGTLNSFGVARAGTAFTLALSEGGRFLAMSLFNSLITPSDLGFGTHAYVRDRWTGTTRRMDVSQTGAPLVTGVTSVDLSQDGRTLAFATNAQDHGVTPRYPSSVFLASAIRTASSDLALVETAQRRLLIGQMNRERVLHWEWASERGAWPNQVMAVGDADGDGFADLFVQNPLTRVVLLGRMSGGEVVSWTALSQTPNPGWNLAGAGDFQGNGRAGLLFQHATSRRLAIALLNGATITGWQWVSQWPEASWRLAAVGDVNADGFADVLFQNSTNNRVTAALLNGAGVVTGWRDLSQIPGASWRLRAVGEFDGDAQNDLVFQHIGTGGLTIALCTGMTVDAWRNVNDNPSRRLTLIGTGAF
jgi:Tol biopolymer transport system component